MTIFGMIIGWLVGVAITIGIPISAGLPPPINALPLVSNLVLALVIYIVIVALGYLFVSLGTANGQPSTQNGIAEFFFGGLIGLNAGANYCLLVALAYGFSLFLPPLLGVAALSLATKIAAVLSLINALAAVRPLAQSPLFAAVLGWSSWLQPMSWIATGIGLVFLFINTIALIGGTSMRIVFEWWTGTVIVHGGITYLAPTGYNLGNFSFVHGDFADAAPWLTASVGSAPLPDPRTVQGIVFHETGHTLTVAACGSIFHIVGAIDENFLTGNFAFSEQLAEGHLRDAVQPWMDWWAPQIASFSGTQTNVPANATSAATQFIPAPAIVAVNTPITFDTLTVPSLATDSDSYPQGSVNPGVIPAVGFLWVVGTAPPGSIATIAMPGAATVTFTPDVGGDYTVLLHYCDGVNGSPGNAATSGIIPVTPGFTPPAPNPTHTTSTIAVLQARIPAVPAGTVNVPLALSSSGTTAGSFFPSSFAWSVTTSPMGAVASINAPTDANPNFIGDTPGAYVVTLTVIANGVSHTTTAPIVLGA